MKNAILCLTLLVTMSASAQKYDWKKQIIPAVLVFTAGAAEGTMDHLQFHYDGNDQFWQPDISWKNKYRNRDPQQGMTFRGKYLVWTTDGWHMMKFTRNLTLFTAFTLKIGEKKKWWIYLCEGAGYWLVNRAGFNLTYKLLQ